MPRKAKNEKPLIPLEEITPPEIVPIDSPNSWKLTEKQKRLAVLMASRAVTHMGIEECYKQAGYNSRSAGFQARKQPEFQAYLEELLDSYNREMIADVYGKLHELILRSKNEKTVLEGIKIWMELTGKNVKRHEIETNVKQEHVFNVDVARFEMDLKEMGLPEREIKRLADKAQAVGAEKVRAEVKRKAVLSTDLDNLEDE